MDIKSKAARSKNMSAIKGKDTRPEMVVRRMLHSMGYRYRLHVKDLPGKPDIYLKKYNTIIFVHGCFWHQHRNCKYAYKPKSNIKFWIPKLKGNAERDRVVERELRRRRYNVVKVWECEIEGQKRKKLEERLKKIKYGKNREKRREILTSR